MGKRFPFFAPESVFSKKLYSGKERFFFNAALEKYSFWGIVFRAFFPSEWERDLALSSTLDFFNPVLF